MSRMDFSIILNRAGVGLAALLLTVCGSAQAAPILDPANGHYYEVVLASGPIGWDAARDAAASRVYSGMTGYLATITSAAENAFITANFNTQDAGHWIGASDGGAEGNWRWMTGPEAGTQFWQGNHVSGAATAPFNYANWIPGYEPNGGSSENYAHILFDNPSSAAVDGTWNDFRLDGYGYIDSYVVEYSAVPEPGGYALLLAGLGLLRLVTRHRTPRDAAAA